MIKFLFLNKDENIMSRAWDKEKIRVPDGNRSHGLPDTSWAL